MKLSEVHRDDVLKLKSLRSGDIFVRIIDFRYDGGRPIVVRDLKSGINYRVHAGDLERASSLELLAAVSS